MGKLGISLFCIFLFLSVPLLGQDLKTDSAKVKEDSLLNEMTNVDKRVQEFVRVDTVGGKAFRRMLKNYLTDLTSRENIQKRDKNGLLLIPMTNWVPFPDYINFNDTVIIDPSFLPVIFDGNVLPQNLDFLSEDSSFVNLNKYSQYHLISPDSTFHPYMKRGSEIQALRKSFYVENPQDVIYNGLVFDKNPVLKDSQIKRTSKLDELLSPEDPIAINIPTIETTTVKKSHWIFQGTHAFQISQTQVSDTWHAGGDNKFDIMNYHKVTLDYKKNKVTFNSRLEWKLNLQKNSADKKHTISIANDYLNLYNVFGYKVFKSWSYSANLTANTPLFTGYKINSDNKWRSFLSPLDVNVGFGMRFEHENVSKADKYKNLKLGVDLSPLSLQYRFINDTLVINKDTNYGIDAGKHSKFEIGSKVIGNITWNFNRYASWTSSLTFFTNYERVQVDMSNRFNYALNRYFSVTADLALRFDDSVKKKDKTFGFLQYNETLSFGLSYTW